MIKMQWMDLYLIWCDRLSLWAQSIPDTALGFEDRDLIKK